MVRRNTALQYFGGKSKIASDVGSIIASIRTPGQLYVEPFIGGGSVFCLVSGPKIGNDGCTELIALYRAMLDGWEPPTEVSEELYKCAKECNTLHLKAFIGFGCSFSGKWFGGYARNSKGDNYAARSAQSIKNKIRGFYGATLTDYDYKDLVIPSSSIVYCDPPYDGTTGYTGVDRRWSSAEFWDIVRVWSYDNLVLISEYNAPDDYICIWESNTHTQIRGKSGGVIPRVEKLFIHQANVDEYASRLKRLSLDVDDL